MSKANPADSSFRSIYFTIPLVYSLFFACNGDPVSVTESQFPEIREIVAPANTYLDPADTITVHVQVFDPQGIPDIQEVTLAGQIPGNAGTFTLAMRDDGLDGDIIAKDGRFVTRIVGTVWQSAGVGMLSATATDDAGNNAESESVMIEIRAGTRGSRPVVESVAFPDTISIDSTFQITMLASISDANSLGDIDSVNYKIFHPAFAVPTISGLLADDGLADDGIANNGIYGARFSNSVLGTETGLYTLRIQAFDRAGNESLALTETFVVKSDLENLPPQITSITAPDTISRSSTGPFVLRAVVSDPNGLGDVSRVFFNTFLPNGQPSSGNPFFMRDDGVRDNNGLGDTTANDGEYALTISITATNATGSYRFEFQAEDRAGLLSEKFVHTIVVVQ